MLTLRDIIVRNERFYPDVEAYVEGERRLTHAQFAKRSRQLASALARLGVRHGDRVALMSMNRLEYTEICGACEWSGYILTHVNFRLAAPEVAHVLSDSTPHVVVFEAQYRALMDGLRAHYPQVEHWVCIGEAGEDGGGWAQDYDALVGGGDPAGPSGEVTSEDWVHITYTSGTTGRAKGVVWSHRRCMRFGQEVCADLQVRPNGRSMMTTPLFHVGAQGIRWGQARLAGTCVLTGASFDPRVLLGLIQRERGEVMFLVAEQIRQMLDTLDAEPFDTSSLRTIVAAGAPISVPLLKRAIARFGQTIMVQYGMTEGQWTTMHRHELRPDGNAEDIRRVASVGHSIPAAQLRVVDDQGRDCPVGVPGEVWGWSDLMLEQYWGNPDATAEALAGGWLHTGDIGYLDEQGYLFLVDRKKDMIISGGENIYCREVEEALNTHAAVVESAVVARPDERWGESVHAYLVLRTGQQVAVEEMIEHCRTRIARYKCPKSVSFVDALPRLPTGKVNKVELRRMVRESLHGRPKAQA